MSDILENPHDMPPEQKALPGIHRGDVNYAGIQEYLPFREMYEPWKLPKDRLVPQDEIQLKLHQALITVLNRVKVMEELENRLMTTPPSFEAFRHNVTHHSGDTAGGMQGLTYAMMKAWPEKVLRTAYDLLCTLWEDHMVPDW